MKSAYLLSWPKMAIHSSIWTKIAYHSVNPDQKRNSFFQSRPKIAIHSSIQTRNRNSFLHSVCSSCPKYLVKQGDANAKNVMKVPFIYMLMSIPEHYWYKCMPTHQGTICTMLHSTDSIACYTCTTFFL